MAAGNTITGQIRVSKLTTLGDLITVAGNFGSAEVDHKADPENAVYINPNPKYNLPVGARSYGAPQAIFGPGEKIRVQHKSASLAEAVDYDADEFFIGTIVEDLNTGMTRSAQLTVQDTEVSANPTSSTSEYVTVFEYTVPDRQRVFISGAFNVAAVENA